MEGGTRGRHRSERTPSSEKEETTGKELEFSLREERKKGREEIRVGDISFARPLGGSFFLFLVCCLLLQPLASLRVAAEPPLPSNEWSCLLPCWNTTLLREPRK